jgi:hypothetical protein
MGINQLTDGATEQGETVVRNSVGANPMTGTMRMETILGTAINFERGSSRRE